MLRSGIEMSFRQQVQLPLTLSTPAILAQLASVLLQYIDASMVGRLGANPAALIGLVPPVSGFSGVSARRRA